MSATMKLNRGSDLQFSVFWPSTSAPGSTEGMNLSGYAVDAFGAHPALAGHISLTITDAQNGEISGVIEWQDDMPTGAIMSFSIRLTQGSLSVTTPAITVQVVK